MCARPAMLALALAAVACTENAPLEVAKVDLERFQGGWYEIAKFPRPTQKGCTGTTAYYRLKSSTELDVFNECHENTLDGPVRRVGARGVVTDPSEPAKLSLDFGGFFGDYWIVEVDASYERAVVGHPSRDYLWILGRTPAMSDSDYADLVERARLKDFDVGRLEKTLQSPEGEPDLSHAESLPSPSDHGCSLGRAQSGSEGLGLLALFVLGVLRRRRS